MTEKALTLEQLQKMRGKWVWIVSPDKDLTVSGWAYVGKDHVYTYWEYERDELVGRVVYNICDYGAWLAYKNPTAINTEDLSIVQQLRKRNKRLKTVVRVQLEQLRDKASHIDDLSDRIVDLEEELDRQYDVVQQLREELTRVTAERDAAVEQLSELECCEFCKHTDCIPRGGVGKCKWEWHGPQKEE